MVPTITEFIYRILKISFIFSNSIIASLYHVHISDSGTKGPNIIWFGQGFNLVISFMKIDPREGC